MNFESLMRLRQVWSTFINNHPRFPEFLKAVKNRQISEGCTIDISIGYPDGKSIKTHLTLRQSDIELVESLTSIM